MSKLLILMLSIGLIGCDCNKSPNPKLAQVKALPKGTSCITQLGNNVIDIKQIASFHNNNGSIGIFMKNNKSYYQIYTGSNTEVVMKFLFLEMQRCEKE